MRPWTRRRPFKKRRGLYNDILGAELMNMSCRDCETIRFHTREQHLAEAWSDLLYHEATGQSSQIVRINTGFG